MAGWQASVALVALSVSLFGFPAGARAQSDDAADTAFWQSIQADNDPAEYRLYLDQFPNGRFAKLAQLRLKTPAAAPVVKPEPVATPAAKPTLPEQDPPDDPPIPPERIEVTPPRARVGQIIAFACVDFPDPTSYDKIVVVPAGTPVMDPTRATEDTKVLWQEYASNCKLQSSKAGPFAPGRYEVRFMTKLYNNDGLFQQKTMTPFTVR